MADYARIGHSSGLDQKRNGTRQTLSSLAENGTESLECDEYFLSERGHQIFRATSALERGTLKSKGGGKLSFHFCGDYDTVEVVIRTIVSVNKLSVYGAVADLCEEFIPPLAIRGRPVAMEKSESLVPPVDLLNIQRPLLTNAQAQRDLQLIKLCTDAVAPGQYFMTKDAEEFSQFDGHVACREYTITSR